MAGGHFRRLLLVVKHTPYEMYLQMKSQGKAPLALRWERLKHRHQVHKECVQDLSDLLRRMDVDFSMVGREELDRQHLKNVDLVVAVGGDGTVLSCSHFLDDTIPLLGVNSDPSRDDEKATTKRLDERRSFGALCACTASNMFEVIPDILQGQNQAVRRTRIQTVVRDALKETKLPPALNDILVAHPIPAAVSRFRLGFLNDVGEETSHFNVWSSGLWISTATGSSAAMTAASGKLMDLNSSELQYMVREHLLEAGGEHLKKEGHGMLQPGNTLQMRWNSQHGCVYVDGNHVRHNLQLGDTVSFSAVAPPVWVFEKPGGLSSGASSSSSTKTAEVTGS